MNSNDSDPRPDNETANAFARMWADSCSKILQAAMTFSPDSVPPEMLRQIRSGIMQSLTQSWETFMRSPQFLQGMQQLMDNALAFRKFTGDVFTKARHESKGIAQEDLDGLRGEIRQSEDRFLAVLEDLSGKLAAIEARLISANQPGKAPDNPQSSRPNPRARVKEGTKPSGSTRRPARRGGKQ